MGKPASLSIGMRIAAAAIGAGTLGCVATAVLVNFEARELVEQLNAGRDAAVSLRAFTFDTSLWLVGTVIFSLSVGLFAARLAVGPMNRLEGVLQRLAKLQPVDAIPYLDRTDVLGRIAHLVAALRDSEQGRRAAEHALSLSEKRLRIAIDGAGVAPWDWDAATNMVTYSERHHHLFGGRLPLKASFADFIAIVHPDDQHLFAPRDRALPAEPRGASAISRRAARWVGPPTGIARHAILRGGRHARSCRGRPMGHHGAA